MEDKKISEAIRLLYKGAKMLPYHCPECGTPIFKYENKMFCPSCGKEAVFESELKEKGINLNEIGDTKASKTPVESPNKKVDTSIEKGNRINIRSKLDDREFEREFELKSRIQSRDLKKYELKEYDSLKKALKFKLNDVSKMLLDANSPDEIERILSLSERILSLLKDIDKRE